MSHTAPADPATPARDSATAPAAGTPEVPVGWRARLGWQGLHYPIPPEANTLPYMLGGITFFGILLLIATGILLDQGYDPAPLSAHDSLVYMVGRVPLGAWIRGLHYWAASLVLVSAVLHLVRVFRARAYRPPREIQWWLGATLLLLLFALAFTGTVLRGDQEGIEALAHAIAGGRLVGGPGALLAPDFAPSTTLLARMHAFHVSALPLLLLALLGGHFWLVRTLGIRSEAAPARPFASHLRRLTGVALLLYAALGVLAWLAPPPLGYAGVQGAEVTKPFWPFLWIYAAENGLGLGGMILAPAILFAFIFLLPLLDRRGSASRRPLWLTALAVLLLAAWVGALLYGALGPRKAHLGMGM